MGKSREFSANITLFQLHFNDISLAECCDMTVVIQIVFQYKLCHLLQLHKLAYGLATQQIRFIRLAGDGRDKECWSDKIKILYLVWC
jgi:hypothetical protein